MIFITLILSIYIKFYQKQINSVLSRHTLEKSKLFHQNLLNLQIFLNFTIFPILSSILNNLFNFKTCLQIFILIWKNNIQKISKLLQHWLGQHKTTALQAENNSELKFNNINKWKLIIIKNKIKKNLIFNKSLHNLSKNNKLIHNFDYNNKTTLFFYQF